VPIGNAVSVTDNIERAAEVRSDWIVSTHVVKTLGAWWQSMVVAQRVDRVTLSGRGGTLEHTKLRLAEMFKLT
jgi:hypothetical protein